MITPGSVDLSFDLDVVAPKGRIGFVALATDFNAEQDIRTMLPEGVEMFTCRVENANPITIETLKAMAPDITRATRCILPGLGADVLVYGCTSGTVAIGEAEIERLMQAAMPGVPCTNPVTAARAALQALGAKKVAILTPYTKDVNTEVVKHFTGMGFEITNLLGFEFENDIEMTSIPRDALMAGAKQANTDDADVVFISCTSLRAASIAAKLEAELGKPVLTSNQVMAWHALQLLNCQDTISGFGQIFDHQLPNAA